MNKLTILSFAFNVVLVLLIFFKSALNDILKQWWKEKEQRKKDSKNYLIELRKKLTRIKNWSIATLITLASYKYGTDPMLRDSMKNSFNELIQKMGETHQYILDNEVYYPTDIRKLYDKFNEKFGKAISETITSVMYRERLLEIINDINPVIENLLTKVENHILNR
jgi:hypothetical protein